MRLSRPRFSLKRTAAPAVLPVSVRDAMDQARVDDTTNARRIYALMRAATGMAEGRLRKSLITQTWQQRIDNWPNFDGDYGYGDWRHNDMWEYVRYNRYRELVLFRPPVQSVTSITYIDPAGVTQTLASDKYILDSDSEPARIAPQLGFVWPAIKMLPFSIKITYKAGYGDTAASVPDTIKQWILLAVAAMYQFRELESEEALKRFGLGDELLEPEAIGDLVL